jgi:hypothetical protein
MKIEIDDWAELNAYSRVRWMMQHVLHLASTSYDRAGQQLTAEQIYEIASDYLTCWIENEREVRNG